MASLQDSNCPGNQKVRGNLAVVMFQHREINSSRAKNPTSDLNLVTDLGHAMWRTGIKILVCEQTVPPFVLLLRKARLANEAMQV